MLLSEGDVRVIAIKIEGELKDLEQIKDSQKATEQFKAIANSSVPWRNGSFVSLPSSPDDNSEKPELVSKRMNQSLQEILERESDWYQKNADSFLVPPQIHQQKNWTVFLENLETGPSEGTAVKKNYSFRIGWMAQPHVEPQGVEVLRMVTLETIEATRYFLDGMTHLVGADTQQALRQKRGMIEQSLGIEFDENRSILEQASSQLEGARELSVWGKTLGEISSLGAEARAEFLAEIEKKSKELKAITNNASLWYTIQDDFSVGYIQARD